MNALETSGVRKTYTKDGKSLAIVEIDEFAARGFAATRLDDVARRA